MATIKDIKTMLLDNGLTTITRSYMQRWSELNLSLDEILIHATDLDKISVKQRNDTASLKMRIIRYGFDIGAEKQKQYINNMKESSKKAYNTRVDNGTWYNIRSVDYWVNQRGYSIDDAKAKIHKMATVGGVNAHKRRIQKPNWKNEVTTCIDYYTSRGMTLDEAKIALKERQATFSLEKCIEKYGSDVGHSKWLERQEKWQTTMNNKSDDEKLNIYIKRTQGTNKFSIEGNNFIEKLISDLNIDSLKCAYGANESYLIANNRPIFYDLTYSGCSKFVLEYNGIVWHPKEGDCDWVSAVGVTYQDMRARDILKKNTAIENGFKYFEIFSDYTEDEYIKLVERINECIKD